MSWLHYYPCVKKIFLKGGLPLQLIYFVTRRCNLRCSHCFLWQELNQPSDELSVEEVSQIARSIPALLSLSLTGGEPFLRPDLPQLAKAFCQRTKVMYLTLFSNGLLPERIAAMVEEILAECGPVAVNFGTSLEGLGEEHDRARGVEGAFKRTVETIRLINKLKKRVSNLSLGVVTTFSALTQARLPALSEFVLKELEADDYTITLLRGNVKDESLKNFDISLYEKFFAEKRKALRRGFRPRPFIRCLISARELQGAAIVAKVHRERRLVTPCYAGQLTAILRENGDCYPCEMLEEKMGNLRDFKYDLSQLWHSQRAKAVRQKIDETKCFCTYECVLTPNLLFNLRQHPTLLMEAIRLWARRLL